MNKIKYFIFLLFPLLIFVQAFGTNSSSIWKRVDKLNKDLTVYKKYIPKAQLEKFFKESIEIKKLLVDEFETLREEAYKSNNLKKMEKYVKRSMPAIVVVIGGDANYINPNTDYFCRHINPQEIEYKFFKVAQSGWYDPDGNNYGGKNIVPDWIKLETGITGKEIPEAKNKILKKWKNLKPSLSGMYLKIANKTIQKLEE